MRRKGSSGVESSPRSGAATVFEGEAPSAATAGGRPRRRLLSAWLPVVALECLVLFLSTRPRLALPGTIPHLDKAAHFAEYALLGGALFRAWRLSGLPRTRAWVWTGVLVAALGAGDEWLQSQVPGRESSLLDWLADLIGAAAGAWLVERGLARRGRRRAPAGSRATEG